MTDRIGPTFGAELAAAGCADGVAWQADGTLFFAPGLPDTTVETVEAVLAAHVPDPPPTFVEMRTMKASLVDARRDAILTGGFAHDFGGAVGTKLLQTRESDETNWLTLQASCLAAVTLGHGATVGAVIRTADNVNVPLSYADGLQVMLAMAAWGAAVYAASWTLKDALAAAADAAALDAVDVAAGWPADP